MNIARAPHLATNSHKCTFNHSHHYVVIPILQTPLGHNDLEYLEETVSCHSNNTYIVRQRNRLERLFGGRDDDQKSHFPSYFLKIVLT